jgi:CBS domain containing-hemolysin-like protein
VVLLLLSAIFSGTETALMILSSMASNDEEEDGSKRTASIRALISDPRRFLVGVLLGNTLVNVAASSVAVGVALRICVYYHFPAWVAVVATVVLMPLLLLVLGEVTPKSVAMASAPRFAAITVPAVRFFFRLTSPLISVLYHLTRFGELANANTSASAEEKRTVLRLSDEEGLIDAEERELLDSAVDLTSTLVREIMVPRIDVTAVDVSTEHAELLDLLEATRFSRMPVYRDSIDQVIGVVHAKDLLRFIHREEEFKLERVARRAFFVPEAMNVLDLLESLRKRNTQLAVVVDEYGGTSGLVTLEDILEELVGEIWDEHDREETLHEVIDARTIVADGRMNVDDLSELVGVDLEGDGYDTLGGLILDRIGEIPRAGREIQARGLVFTVERVVRNRIRRVRILLPPEHPPPVTTDDTAAAPRSKAALGPAMSRPGSEVPLQKAHGVESSEGPPRAGDEERATPGEGSGA